MHQLELFGLQPHHHQYQAIHLHQSQVLYIFISLIVSKQHQSHQALQAQPPPHQLGQLIPGAIQHFHQAFQLPDAHQQVPQHLPHPAVIDSHPDNTVSQPLLHTHQVHIVIFILLLSNLAHHIHTAHQPHHHIPEQEPAQPHHTAKYSTIYQLTGLVSMTVTAQSLSKKCTVQVQQVVFAHQTIVYQQEVGYAIAALPLAQLPHQQDVHNHHLHHCQ